MTVITEPDLDRLYTELCRDLSDIGKERALVFLACFALLTIVEIGDVERVRRLIAQARDASVATDAPDDSPR